MQKYKSFLILYLYTLNHIEKSKCCAFIRLNISQETFKWIKRFRAHVKSLKSYYLSLFNVSNSPQDIVSNITDSLLEFTETACIPAIFQGNYKSVF
jgi:hypothetical protein